MREVTSGVWQIGLAPRNAVNAYLIGETLIDAGTSGMGKKLPQRLSAHRVSAHALTHAHPDHAGGSKAVCEAFGVELWAPAGDAADVERGAPTLPPGAWTTPLLKRARGLPAHPVARQLAEGDEVAGFTVLEVPGHSPGHVAYWHEADRVLIAGDVFVNIHMLTMRPGLRSPPRVLTYDPGRNEASMRRLAELRPRVALFGHGPPVFDAEAKLAAFVEKL
ncbi:MAG: MBL fold metallo-hydrolase [Solirubrobacterales bacterium]|nr:MBL fold metallo-hydrolase [Solirubrobacterales bacterium]